jgi:hypothetical protein
MTNAAYTLIIFPYCHLHGREDDLHGREDGSSREDNLHGREDGSSRESGKVQLGSQAGHSPFQFTYKRVVNLSTSLM